MKYAVWFTHIDGRLDEHAPRTVVTTMPLWFGDKLPLANVDGWITEVIEGDWTDDHGHVFDARAKAVAGPTPDDFDERFPGP